MLIPPPPHGAPAECLKDLQRFLAHDDPIARPAFLLLGQYRTVETDLVPLVSRCPLPPAPSSAPPLPGGVHRRPAPPRRPLPPQLVHYADDEEVAFNALKLATLMTFPVEADAVDAPRQREVVWETCQAFVGEPGALGALITLAAGPLSRHPRMTEKDGQTVQLILTFVRHLLQMPLPAGGGADTGRRLQRARGLLVRRLGSESVLELVSMVAQHSHQSPFKSDATLLLGIVSDLFQVRPARAPRPRAPPPPCPRPAPALPAPQDPAVSPPSRRASRSPT